VPSALAKCNERHPYAPLLRWGRTGRPNTNHAAAVHAGRSAWIWVALGALLGATLGIALAVRRWQQPYIGGGLGGGIAAGVVGGIFATSVSALPSSVKAAIWAAIAAMYVPAIAELVHRSGTAGGRHSE
jgi:hypothetical protein